jgi:hypothetical protein
MFWLLNSFITKVHKPDLYQYKCRISKYIIQLKFFIKGHDIIHSVFVNCLNKLEIYFDNWEGVHIYSRKILYVNLYVLIFCKYRIHLKIVLYIYVYNINMNLFSLICNKLCTMFWVDGFGVQEQRFLLNSFITKVHKPDLYQYKCRTSIKLIVLIHLKYCWKWL